LAALGSLSTGLVQPDSSGHQLFGVKLRNGGHPPTRRGVILRSILAERRRFNSAAGGVAQNGSASTYRP